MGTSCEFLNSPGFTAFLSHLNDSLGLCFSLTSEGQDKLGSNFFTRFSMAFPEKRRQPCISWRKCSPAALMEVASEVLVEKDNQLIFLQDVRVAYTSYLRKNQSRQRSWHAQRKYSFIMEIQLMKFCRNNSPM